jgi:hypothetical protein
MWPAFPTSDYYGGSVPTRAPEWTAHLPAPGLAGRREGQPRAGSHVHLTPIDGVGAQLTPQRPRHEYAADLPRGLPASHHKPAPGVVHTDYHATGMGTRRNPAHIPQI